MKTHGKRLDRVAAAVKHRAAAQPVDDDRIPHDDDIGWLFGCNGLTLDERAEHIVMTSYAPTGIFPTLPQFCEELDERWNADGRPVIIPLDGDQMEVMLLYWAGATIRELWHMSFTHELKGSPTTVEFTWPRAKDLLARQGIAPGDMPALLSMALEAGAFFYRAECTE